MYVKSKRQENTGVSLLKHQGNLVSDAVGKANMLIRQFQSVFTQPTEDNLPDVWIGNIPRIDALQITTKGVANLLKNINAGKAHGPDGIPSVVLKEAAPELAPGLTVIFKESIRTGRLPSTWRKANVTPVFKKGDRHQPENYRPVSLTSVTCKLLEHIICKHMLTHLEKWKILTPLNHGFRRGYSCETQLLAATDDLMSSFDRGEQVDVLALDFSKAFDTVPHNKLLHKVKEYGITGNILDWLEDFLCNREMTVVVDGETSTSIHVESGVPQGTVLGPILFLCHINDLPTSVKSQVRLFADDCLLYRTIRHFNDHIALQEDLKSLEKWAQTWGMNFNTKKCFVMSVKKKSSFYYSLDNNILQGVNNLTYLGVLLSDDMKWGPHINNIVSKAASKLGFLRRNLKSTPRDTKKLAYLSIIRSTMEYSAAIWDPSTQKDIDNIERIQRKSARFIHGDYVTRERGCVTEMLRRSDLAPLEERRKNIRLALLFKIANGWVAAIDSSQYLTPARQGRRIKPREFTGCVAKNIVAKSVKNNSRCFITIHGRTDQYKNSFFPRTIVEWNELEDTLVCSDSVESFKGALTKKD
jgi:hypothetical protein